MSPPVDEREGAVVGCGEGVVRCEHLAVRGGVEARAHGDGNKAADMRKPMHMGRSAELGP